MRRSELRGNLDLVAVGCPPVYGFEGKHWVAEAKNVGKLPQRLALQGHV